MASGASTEPPPLPPADYTPVPKEEWAKKRMPPLKGVIVDPEYPPTAEEALQAIKNHDRNYDSQWQGQASPSNLSPLSSLPQTTRAAPASDLAPLNTNRSSGSSKIFGRVAGDSSTTSMTSDSSSTTASSTSSSIPKWQQKPPQEVTSWDILTSLSPTDFRSILAQPCFRETFMYSIISGVLVAGALWTLGKRRRWIVNGGMGTATAVYAGVFPYCMWQRRSEKRNVMLVKETWEETRAEKRAVWEAYKAKKKGEDETREREKAGSVGGRVKDQSASRTSSSWGSFWSSSGNTVSKGREG